MDPLFAPFRPARLLVHEASEVVAHAGAVVRVDVIVPVQSRQQLEHAGESGVDRTAVQPWDPFIWR